eukprot:21553-Chlamydomonas_euryale.AAC.2
MHCYLILLTTSPTPPLILNQKPSRKPTHQEWEALGVMACADPLASLQASRSLACTGPPDALQRPRTDPPAFLPVVGALACTNPPAALQRPCADPPASLQGVGSPDLH